MRVRPYIQKCSLFFGASVLLSGCTGQEPGVNLYTDMDAATIKPIVAQWEREVGVPIRVTHADAKDVQSGMGLSQRLMEEKGSLKADVYWGRDVSAMQKLVVDGTMTPMRVTLLNALPELCREDKGNWFGLGARVRVFLYRLACAFFCGIADRHWYCCLAHGRGGCVTLVLS